jgi:hypothetical protein
MLPPTPPSSVWKELEGARAQLEGRTEAEVLVSGLAPEEVAADGRLEDEGSLERAHGGAEAVHEAGVPVELEPVRVRIG